MAKSEIDKLMDAVFSSDVRTGKTALVVMDRIVTDIGKTRNTDPLRRFMSKARNHHHQNFTAVMGLLLRLAYGEKAIVATKDDKHPTGTNVKIKWSGERPVSNFYHVTIAKAVEGGKPYNDKALLKTIRDYLKPDAVGKMTLDDQAKVLDTKLGNVVKWLGNEAPDVSIERAVNAFRAALKDAFPTGRTVYQPEGDDDGDEEDNVLDLDTYTADEIAKVG